jgi:hypothetical protein
MVSVDLPRIDDRLELVCPRFPNARFLVRVREVKPALLSVAIPIVAGEPMKFVKAERLALRWGEDTLFIGAARSATRDGLHWDIAVLEALPRQRRGYFRWTVPLPLRFAVVQDARGPFQTALTLDISGGGLCVPWNEPIAKGAELELELDLEKEPARALARVVELRPNPDPPPSFHLALQFVRITDADRSRIVRFVFAKQWAAREH